MHSDLSQPERDKTMQDFKAGFVDILVATDIVSRGIDIDDITLVVNYDTPRDPEDYVHRIGRTARAGRTGRSITLVGEKDRSALSAIERMMQLKINRCALPEGMTPPDIAPVGEKKRRGGKGKRNASGSAHQTEKHKPANASRKKEGYRRKGNKKTSDTSKE